MEVITASQQKRRKGWYKDKKRGKTILHSTILKPLCNGHVFMTEKSFLEKKKIQVVISLKEDASEETFPFAWAANWEFQKWAILNGCTLQTNNYISNNYCSLCTKKLSPLIMVDDLKKFRLT